MLRGTYTAVRPLPVRLSKQSGFQSHLGRWGDSLVGEAAGAWCRSVGVRCHARRGLLISWCLADRSQIAPGTHAPHRSLLLLGLELRGLREAYGRLLLLLLRRRRGGGGGDHELCTRGTSRPQAQVGRERRHRV